LPTSFAGAFQILPAFLKSFLRVFGLADTAARSSSLHAAAVFVRSFDPQMISARGCPLFRTLPG
jgi:hypothetical protein